MNSAPLFLMPPLIFMILRDRRGNVVTRSSCLLLVSIVTLSTEKCPISTNRLTYRDHHGSTLRAASLCILINIPTVNDLYRVQRSFIHLWPLVDQAHYLANGFEAACNWVKTQKRMSFDCSSHDHISGGHLFNFRINLESRSIKLVVYTLWVPYLHQINAEVKA